MDPDLRFPLITTPVKIEAYVGLLFVVTQDFERLRLVRPDGGFMLSGPVQEGVYWVGHLLLLRPGDTLYYKSRGRGWRKKFSLAWWRGQLCISFGYTWGPRKGRWPIQGTPYYPGYVYGQRLRQQFREPWGSPDGTIPVRTDLEGYWWVQVGKLTAMWLNAIPASRRMVDPSVYRPQTGTEGAGHVLIGTGSAR